MSYAQPSNIYQQLGHVQPATAVHPQFQQTRPPPVARSAYQHQQHQQQVAAFSNTNRNPRPRPVSLPVQARPLPTPSQIGRRSPLDQYAPPPLHPTQYRPKFPNQAAPQLINQRSSTLPPAQHNLNPSPERSPQIGHSGRVPYDVPQHPRGGHSPQASSSSVSPQPMRGRSNTYGATPNFQEAPQQPQWSNNQHRGQNHPQYSSPPQQSYPNPTQPQMYQNSSQYQPPPSQHGQPPFRPRQAPPSPSLQYSAPIGSQVQHQTQHPQPQYNAQRSIPSPSTPTEYVVNPRISSPNPTSAALVRKYSKKKSNSPVRFSEPENSSNADPPASSSSSAISTYTKPSILPSLPEISDPKSFVPLYKRQSAMAKSPAFPSTVPSEMRIKAAAVPESIPMSRGQSNGSNGRPLPTAPGTSGPGSPIKPSFSPQKKSLPLPGSAPHNPTFTANPHLLNRSDTVSTTSSTRSNGSMHRRERAILSESDDSDTEPQHQLEMSDFEPPSPGVGIRDLPTRTRQFTSPEPPSPGMGITDLPPRGPSAAGGNFGALRSGFANSGVPEPPKMSRGSDAQSGGGWNQNSAAPTQDRYPGQAASNSSQTLRFAAMSPVGQTPSDRKPYASTQSQQPPAPAVSRQHQSAFGAQYGSPRSGNLPQLPSVPHSNVPTTSTQPQQPPAPALNRQNPSAFGAQYTSPRSANFPPLPSVPDSNGPKRTIPSVPTSPKTMTRAQFMTGASSPRSPHTNNLDLDSELDGEPPRSGFSPQSMDRRNERGHPSQQAPPISAWNKPSPSPPQPGNEIRHIQQPIPHNGVATHIPHDVSRARPHHAQSHPPPVQIESPAPLGGREQMIKMAEWDTASHDRRHPSDSSQRSHVPQQQQQPQTLTATSKPRPKSRALPQPGQHSRAPQEPPTTPKSNPRPVPVPVSVQPSTPKVQVFEIPGISVSSGPSSPTVPIISIDGGGGPSITVSPEVPTINIGSESPSVPSISIGVEGNINGGPPVNKGNPHNRPPIQRYPGLRCGLCAATIVGRMVDAMGVRWHPDCFRCTICDDLLEHVSSYEQDGRPYCHLDYHENFAPRCFHCETAILEPRFISIDDEALGGKRTYHENHFFCAECGDPFLDPSRKTSGLLGSSEGELTLSEGSFEGFTVHKGHPYCEACHIRLRNPKCKKCKRPIRDGDEAVEALGGKWCRRCFCCAGCERPFHDPTFYERDKKAWCGTCFSIILRNEV